MTRRLQVAFYVLPCLLLVSAVSFYPVVNALYTSLHETNYMVIAKFVGLNQYARLISDSSVLHNVLTSIKYALASLALTIPLGLGLAIALNQKLPLIHVFRTIVIAPWVVSQTVAALLWLWLLDPSYGPIAYSLTAWFGVQMPLLVGSIDLAMPTIVLANTWLSYPLATIMLLAALQTIGQDVYDAARIDGCSAWQRLRWIVLPLLNRTLVTTSIILTLHSINMVTLLYIMTGGGPLAATESISIRVFREAFVNYKLGYASALGIMILVMNLLFSLAYIRALRSDGAVETVKGS